MLAGIVAKKSASSLSRTNKARANTPSRNRFAIVERLKRRSMGAGTFSAPCIPSLCEHYFAKLMQLFEALDRRLEPVERASMLSSFRERLERGFAVSPYARFVFAYRPSESNPLALDCEISILAPSLEEQYQDWLQNTGATQPFGKHPDAMVVHTAEALAGAREVRILDVGAGSGRNALPLARAGHAVDTIEPVPALAHALREAAGAEGLVVRVFEQDIFAELGELSSQRYDLIVLSEVTPHFSQQELERALPRLASVLAPDGTLLFNAFVARTGYQPNTIAKETAQSVWSTFFTRKELDGITSPLGLRLSRNEACVSYERLHAPVDAWPPTTWYVNWAQGHNLFSAAGVDAPIELWWLAYSKT
jgi:SAM-dependent methyltransferase